MSAGKRAEQSRATREARSAAVRRVVSCTDYLAVVAAEFGVSVAAVDGWCQMWMERRGPWNNQPLEAVEVDLGYTIAPRYYRGVPMGERVVTPEKRMSPTVNHEEAAFLDSLSRPPGRSNRQRIASAFGELCQNARDRLTPAFDAYLRAFEHAEEMRRLTKLAFDLATAELAQREPAKKAA